MITIYGIPNCDTMQKAMKWLNARNVPYRFHNYREDGLDKATVAGWLKHLPLDKVINLRSTTWRELTPEQQASISDLAGATELMLQYPSLIKRPLWDLGDGRFHLGFKEAEVAQLLGV